MYKARVQLQACKGVIEPVETWKEEKHLGRKKIWRQKKEQSLLMLRLEQVFGR